MPIPIQISNSSQFYKQSTNMGPGNQLINGKPGLACNGYNGNLNSFIYGITPEYKQKMIYLYNNVGLLAQINPQTFVNK